MSGETTLKDNLSLLYSNFEESTMIAPNKNGDKQSGAMDKSECTIEKDGIIEFCRVNSIGSDDLFLAGLTLTLNKFNFSDKNLIFTDDRLPFATNFENRQMSVKEFLSEIHKDYARALDCSAMDDGDFVLEPEFCFGFDEKPLDFRCSNHLSIVEGDDVFLLTFEYNDELYTSDFIDLFLKSLEKIINQTIASDINRTHICDIAIENENENVTFREVELPFIHKRSEMQVEEKPDKTALIACDATLTYGQLNAKANVIANALIKRGVKPKSNILVMLSRNSDLIAAILGVLKAGCAFIPIDLEYPKDRIEYIFKNSQADYMISDGSIENSLDVNELLLESCTENPQADITPEDRAYMIYTSGSTGNPKGVMISHRNITNLFSKDEDSLIYNFYSRMNRTVAFSTVSFDAFLLDFMALTFGLEVVLANDDEIKSIKDLTDLIKREKPDSIACSTPSRLKQYLEYDEFACEFENFRNISVGGERCPRDLIEEISKIPDLDIYNAYGPTEASVASNAKKITSADDITVGKPLHNCITEVRDIDGKRLPSGVMGELYIGGTGVARGYYNMEEKTKEAFISLNGISYYRTGDFAIELPNGEIDIKGRIDNQIKLRGLRIEIGEIESNISKFPAIKRNAVAIKEINNVEHLCAYFTADAKINTYELRDFLSERLTRYMVPTVFMQLDEMPMLPNGKTNLKELPKPKLELRYVAPENELKQLICAIFSSTLDVGHIGAEDNFFEIGGTSLIASKIIIDLLKRGYDVRYDDVFNNQTPRELAKFLSGEYEVAESDYDIIDSYDYTNINKLLDENTIESFRNGEMQEIGNLLLTGVTGYLGIHVLHEYLKSEEGIAYCIMRKAGFDSCKDRLSDLMDYYFDEDLNDLIESRTILVEGDITNLDDFKKLESYPIDTVMNCAAVVKHYTHDNHIFKVNVDGVINGLKFAQSNDMKYIQISTISALSYLKDENLYGKVNLDERTLYYGQDLTNKYANSKFLAERMVLEAAVNGLNAKVIRLGNLMARYSDGVFQKNYDTNAFLASVKSIKDIQFISDSKYAKRVEMSPIDCTAKAILMLSKTPKECRVFNCHNNNIITSREIIDALNSFGFGITKVSDEDFVEICMENTDEAIQGLITSDKSLDDLIDEKNEPELYVRNGQTVEILDELGFDWPVPDDEYLRRMIGYLNRIGFFD